MNALPGNFHQGGFRWRPWRELAILGLIVMDLCWVVPWYRSLTPATYAVSAWRAFFLLGALLLEVHLVVRLMNFIHLRMDIRRVIFIILIIANILVGLNALLYSLQPASVNAIFNRPIRSINELTHLIPDEVVVILAVLAVCWRGASLAQEFVEPLTVLGNFRLGIFMFLGFVFINTLATGESPGVLIIVFLFAGLTSMAAARIWTISLVRGGGQNAFDRRWFISMSLATIVSVGLAALVARIASKGELLRQVAGLFMGLLALVGLAVISPAIYFVPRLIEEFPTLSKNLGGFVDGLRGLRTALTSLAAGYLDRLMAFLERIGVIRLLPLLKTILIWGTILAIGFLVVVNLSRWVLRERSVRAEHRQELLNTRELLQLLRRAFQERVRNLEDNLVGMIRLRRSPRWLTAARIRRIYAFLMELSADLGTPRLSAQTPLEYLPLLDQLFPQQGIDLRLITQAYLQVRYGEIPETRAEVDEVESAWKRLNTRGQELLKQRRDEPGKKAHRSGEISSS